MIQDVSFTITPGDLALGRLDKIILARFPSSTRALLGDAFAKDAVFVDGRPCHKAFSPSFGSVVTLPRLLESRDRVVVPEEGPLEIAYVDASLLAVNKPGGQPCHPIAAGETGTIANLLAARHPEMDGIGGDPLMPGLLHRIDAGTSGVVLCARTQASYDFIRGQFTERTVKKIYRAIVSGVIDKPGGISGRLAHSSSFRGRMRCVSGIHQPKGERAMFAETFYKPISAGNGNTLLEVTIYTGVTHQIRCQLASIGHPILGDSTYGSSLELTGDYGDYHLLHAASIEFVHPDTHAPLVITAPCASPFR